MGPFGMDCVPKFQENFTGLKCQRGRELVAVETVSHAVEDGTTDMKHMLMEPKHNNASMGGFLDHSKENCKMEGFSYGFDIGSMPTYGGLDSYNTLDGEAGFKFEMLDGILDEVDEVDDIYATEDLSAIGEHFLLDIELTGKACELDSGLYGVPNSSSESHSSGISGNIDSQLLSESSKETAPQSERQTVSHDKAVYQEPVKEGLGSTSNNLQSLDESDDDKKPLATFIASQTEPGSRPKKKLDKATRRLDSLGGTNFHASYDFRPRRGQLKKCQPTLEDIQSDQELDASESEDYHPLYNASKNRSDRRKHQRMWTLAEVVKLVDGISQFGVGKWTDIKNLLFQSATHRTPIDLRDKWRNLLRASYVNSERCNHSSEEVEEKPRSTARPLPKHILHRVYELATLHPYPHSKCSASVRNASPAHLSVNAQPRRNSRRKKRC